ncbi:MAG: sigma-70 family RNA polymerase sigma factor, partial [Bacteroidales bacterium]|nr:sigma-70 family RNA polymerase sigma factor [Bacteroidales bacterium]
PEKARTVIHLRDVEGYEMEEIADIVGDDVATLRVTLSRARKTIRERTIKIMNYGL